MLTALLIESGCFNRIGSYWDNKGENEIDLIAINDLEKALLVVEVKRQIKCFNQQALASKTQHLLQKLNCSGYQVAERCFTLDNLDEVWAEFALKLEPNR